MTHSPASIDQRYASARIRPRERQFITRFLHVCTNLYGMVTDTNAWRCYQLLHKQEGGPTITRKQLLATLAIMCDQPDLPFQVLPGRSIMVAPAPTVDFYVVNPRISLVASTTIVNREEVEEAIKLLVAQRYQLAAVFRNLEYRHTYLEKEVPVTPCGFFLPDNFLQFTDRLPDQYPQIMVNKLNRLIVTAKGNPNRHQKLGDLSAGPFRLSDAPLRWTDDQEDRQTVAQALVTDLVRRVQAGTNEDVLVDDFLSRVAQTGVNVTSNKATILKRGIYTVVDKTTIWTNQGWNWDLVEPMAEILDHFGLHHPGEQSRQEFMDSLEILQEKLGLTGKQPVLSQANPAERLLTPPRPLSRHQLNKLYRDANLPTIQVQKIKRFGRACTELYGVISDQDAWIIYRFLAATQGVVPMIDHQHFERAIRTMRMEPDLGYYVYPTATFDLDADSRDRLIVNPQLISFSAPVNKQPALLTLDMRSNRQDYIERIDLGQPFPFPFRVPDNFLQNSGGTWPQTLAAEKFYQFLANLRSTETYFEDMDGKRIKVNPAYHGKTLAQLTLPRVPELSDLPPLPKGDAAQGLVQIIQRAVRSGDLVYNRDFFPNLLLTILEDLGVKVTDPLIKIFATLLMPVINTTPCWYLSGWTVDDLWAAKPGLLAKGVTNEKD